MKGRKSLLPVATLIALPLLLYAPLLFGGKVLYWGVYLLQFHPWQQLAVEQVRAGHWPLWNPYLGAGSPLAANLQTAAFYPINALFLFLPVERAFGWELALHVALAGLFAYYLGRTLGLSRFSALVSGLAYGGGGYIVAHWVFPSMVYAAAWLPLVLALTERVIGKSGTGKLGGNVALLAAAVALQLLAGHAQTSLYSLLIVVAFALVRARNERPALRRSSLVAHYVVRLARVALGVAWGFALAAIQLLPSAELAAHSQRPGPLSDLRFAYELSFWPWRLITLLAPDFFGNPARNEYWAYGTYWEEAAFVGILPLMLGLLALAAWWRKRSPFRRPSRAIGRSATGEGGSSSKPAAKASPGLALVPFCALLAFLSLVLALGDHTPLYPFLFRYVPGMGLFQAPARLLIGYALGMALLAGIGAGAFRPTPRTRTVLRLAVLVGLGTGIAGGLARLALPAIRPSFGNSAIRLGLTLTLAAALLLLRGRRPLHASSLLAGGTEGGRWQAMIVLLVTADLLAFGWGLAPGSDPAVYRAPVASAQFLQSQPPGRVFVAEPYARQMYERYISLRSFGSTGPACLQDLRETLLPNLNAVHHLPGVGNYDPLTIGLYRDLRDRLLGEEGDPPALDEIHPGLNLFGVRYVITDGELPWPLIYDAGPHIYRNDAALPAAFVAPQARIVEDPETRLDTLFDPAFDPRREVLLSRPPSRPPADRVQREQASQPLPSVLREGPERVIIQVTMAQAGYLVLTDTYYPGWQATVDGQPAEILPADHAFRAISLDEGEHTVLFRYAPLSFRLGAWITAGAALLLGVTLAAGQLQRRVR